MAKTAITEVSANNTFQVWLDKTNELVDLFKTDAVTASLASSAGDTTIGNVTLEGIFTANTVIVQDLLRADQISPKSGSTAVQVNSPVNIVTNQTVLERLSSSLGPRLSLFNTTDTDWQIGFENNTTKNFVISNGSNVFRLSGTGNLELTGILSGTAQTANTVGLIATNSTNATHFPLFANTATGTAQVRSDSGFTYNPSTGVLSTTAFAGNLTGNVTGNLNGTATNATNAAFATSAGNASTVTNGVYLNTNQTITGSKTFSSNITTTAIVSGAYLNQDITEAPFFGTVNQSASNYAPLIKIRSTGTSNVTTGSFGILHNTDNTQEVTIHLIQNGDANSRVWRFTQAGDFVSPGDVTAFSDERLKSNIKTIEKPLDKVMALRGVSYEKDGKSSIGVIAQEIEKIIPEVVHDGEFKSVAYGNLVGLLIEAIKELKSELDEIKGR